MDGTLREGYKWMTALSFGEDKKILQEARFQITENGWENEKLKAAALQELEWAFARDEEATTYLIVEANDEGQPAMRNISV